MKTIVNGSVVSVNEAFTDRMTQYIDDRAIEYLKQNLRESKETGKKSKYEYYSDLADRATDPVMRVFYEFAMLLPEEQAMNLAREYYQREIRSGTISYDQYESENDEGETMSGIMNTKFSVSAGLVDKGVFSAIAAGERRTPERNMELSDLFEKLFFTYLEDVGRLVLCARLVTGSSTGRVRKSEAGKLDLSEIMHRTPPEYAEVLRQYQKMLDAGIPEDQINAKNLLTGWKPTETHPVTIKGIASHTDYRDGQADLEEGIHMMVGDGYQTVGQIKKFFHVNEELITYDDGTDLDDVDEAAGDDRKILKTIEFILSGHPVRYTDLNKALKFVIADNIKSKSPMLKSKLFRNRKPKYILQAMLKMLKSGREEQIKQVQFAILAPALTRNAKAKKMLNNILNSKGKQLLR